MACVFLAGLLIFSYPYIQGAIVDWQMRQEAQSFIERTEQQTVTEPEEIARRHMLDCLFLLTVTEFQGKKILFDTGQSGDFLKNAEKEQCGFI